MPDKPQPGKDKDLRFIRHAIDDADRAIGFLRTLLEGEPTPGVVEIVSEALLLSIEQYDLLNQMLDDTAIGPAQAIETNRSLRDLLKLLTHERLEPAARVTTATVAHTLGNQLKSLMVVKEIRGRA